MKFVLLLFYPVCMHLAVVVNMDWIKGVALIFLALGILYKKLFSGERAACVCFALVAGACIAAILIDAARYFAYLPPVVITALVCFGFASSLVPGRVPLVTSIGEAARGPLSEEMKAYTRVITQIWACVLAMMTLWSAVLPFVASEHVWSVVTNIFNYVLIAVMFCVEFVYRKRRFGSHDHPGFRQYLRIVFEAKTDRP